MGKTSVKKNILFFMLISSIFVTLLLFCPWDTSANTAVNDNVTVTVDGKRIIFDSKPYINKDYRTMVPVRFVAQELGATVNWDSKKQSVLILMKNKTINLYIGKTTAMINGSSYTLDTKAELKNARTMVPLRFISEALGANVNWSNSTKTVSITTGKATPDKNSTVIGKTIKVVAETLNVRENPGAEYGVLSKILYGDKYEVLDRALDINGKEWYKIKLATGKTGWIAGWYVEIASGDDAGNEDYDNYKEIREKGIVTGSIVNIRKDPNSEKDNIVAQVKKGDVLNLIGKLDAWYKVRLTDNKEGWIFSSLITIQNEDIPSRGDPDNLTTISDVSFFNDTLTIKGNASLKYSISTLQNPLRLVIDLPSSVVKIDSSKLESTVNSSFAKSVRIAQFTEGTTRVVIDLKKPISYDVQKHNNNKEISFKLEERSIKGKVIVLDAGHGVLKNGKYFDPGAVGPTGVREVDVVLEIAKKTEKLLTDKGAKVIMTRTSSKTNLSASENAALTLSGRATKANNINADIFVSIHANANTNRSVKGTSVYFYGTNSQAMRVERQILARLIQNSVVKEAGTRNIGIIEANFAVLTQTKMPSVLVETAFISNPEEEKLLTNNDFQNKLARGITEGISNYFAQ